MPGTILGVGNPEIKDIPCPRGNKISWGKAEYKTAITIQGDERCADEHRCDGNTEEVLLIQSHIVRDGKVWKLRKEDDSR